MDEEDQKFAEATQLATAYLKECKFPFEWAFVAADGHRMRMSFQTSLPSMLRMGGALLDEAESYARKN